MTPSTLASVNTGLMRTTLGELLLAAQGEVLVGVWFSDQKGIPGWAQHAKPGPLQGVLGEAQQQLGAYLAGRRTDFDLPMRPLDGTDFQRRVWHTLMTIPYGTMVSYGDIASAIARPQAVRAVGGAIGRNPLGIVVPCHRVVGQGGQLTGYTGGLDRKRALLALEAADA